MNYLHTSLHLQHHHHTGKVLHHRHTSYRGLAIIIGLAGVFMLGLNMMSRATADTLYVWARNPAPIPTQAAIITSPRNGTAINDLSVTVSGICPPVTPRAIIVIYEGATDLGSAACDTSNRFSIRLTLPIGRHTLVARSYTITDDTGPDSTPVTVNIAPARVPTLPISTPLTLTIDRPFIVFGPGKDALWIGTASGGHGPYKFVVDWGDHTVSTYVFATDTQQRLTHHYRVMQPYDITFTVTDQTRQLVVKHFAAVTPYLAPPVAGTQKPGLGLRGNGLIGAYGAYLVLLATFGMLWVRGHQFAYAKVPIKRKRQLAYATVPVRRSQAARSKRRR